MHDPAVRRLPRPREPPLPRRDPRPGPARHRDVQVVARQRLDRASVVDIDAARTELTVTRRARRRPADRAGDWIEVTDDQHELHRLPGVMRKVGPVDEVAATLTLPRLCRRPFDATDATRHTRVTRWDQKGIVRDASQNAVDDVDATAASSRSPREGLRRSLEDGIRGRLCPSTRRLARSGPATTGSSPLEQSTPRWTSSSRPRRVASITITAGSPILSSSARSPRLPDDLAAPLRVRRRRRLRVRRVCQRRIAPVGKLHDPGRRHPGDPGGRRGPSASAPAGIHSDRAWVDSRRRPVRAGPRSRHRERARVRRERPGPRRPAPSTSETTT